jgi:nitrate/nitrite transport system substrate-binding protein
MARIGFIPLVDAAPLIVAKERGYFAEAGVEVELAREASWASLRDKVAVGALDGAHMLAPMPLAMATGASPLKVPMVAAVALNLGGNTITLANRLWDRLGEVPDGPLSAARLRPLLPLTFATVYPFSSHSYELRAWLAAGGIDPDRDVRLVVVPPPQMVAHLSAGTIDGFCVGEPWGTIAARQGLGRVALTSRDLFAGRLEKVLGVTRAWAGSNPDTHLAIIEAVIAASRWCDANRCETAEILSQPQYLNAPFDAVIASLLGENGLPKDLIQFHRWAANFPWRSHAVWYLRQMVRWGQLPAATDLRAAAEDVFRPDIYRLAALRLGLDVPLVDYKDEGRHAAEWRLLRATRPITLGPDLMLDGAAFDPGTVVPLPPPILEETSP